MTREQFIASAIIKASVGAGQDDTGFYTDVADVICDEALKLFAEKTAMDPARSHLLRGSAPVDVALDGNGMGDLGATSLLPSVLHLAIITDTNGKQLEYIPHRADFLSPLPSLFGYWTRDGTFIFARAAAAPVNEDGTITPAEGPLKVWGYISPAVTDIPVTLETESTDFFAQLLIAKRQASGRRMAGTETGRGAV